MDYRILNNDELMHYGVKGMQWGVRNREKHITGSAKPGSLIKRKKVNQQGLKTKKYSQKDGLVLNKDWKTKRVKYRNSSVGRQNIAIDQYNAVERLMKKSQEAKDRGDKKAAKGLDELVQKYYSAFNKNGNNKKIGTDSTGNSWYEYEFMLTNRGAKRSGIKRKRLSGKERTK